jgi:hypothetical protein
MDIIQDFKTLLVTETDLNVSVQNIGKDRPNSYTLWIGGESLNLTIGIEEITRLLAEKWDDNTDSIDILTDTIYQIYKCRREHDDYQWKSFHDTLANASGKTYTRMQLEKIFVFAIPEYLRNESYHWGMDDTPWGDNLFTWWQENITWKDETNK